MSEIEMVSGVEFNKRGISRSTLTGQPASENSQIFQRQHSVSPRTVCFGAGNNESAIRTLPPRMCFAN